MHDHRGVTLQKICRKSCHEEGNQREIHTLFRKLTEQKLIILSLFFLSNQSVSNVDLLICIIFDKLYFIWCSFGQIVWKYIFGWYKYNIFLFYFWAKLILLLDVYVYSNSRCKMKSFFPKLWVMFHFIYSRWKIKRKMNKNKMANIEVYMIVLIKLTLICTIHSHFSEIIIKG